MIGKYSLSNLFEAYNRKKDIINAYVRGDVIENYNEGDKILGLEMSAFLILFIISLAIWIIALVLLIKYWKVIPDWAKVLGVIGIISTIGGPIMTIIVVLIAKNMK